ncbi:tail fiber domain-containing protein [Microbacterium sp. XT11]|uniref:tail fiber domain-containing protein n=1 Tax=Microbacterium sp. XT11 TaxID=367477 RepID=UPI0008372CCC|nr:tail fiber domain-containing protein [Microbacterium sp. XT11]
MPESYTGNEGTTAAANGMAAMDGNEDRRNGWLAINKTRDYIVTKMNAAISSAVAQAKAYTDQKFAAISLTWNAITGKPTSFPPSAHNHDQLVSGSSRWGIGGAGEWWTNNAVGVYGNFAATGRVDMPNLSAVTSGYVAMYKNGDGRVGISPSARRFKKDIRDRAYTLDDALAIQVRDYRLRASVFGSNDAPVEVGVIAEELIDAGLSEFVAFDEHGEPLSVHYERLALVALGALRDTAAQLDLIRHRLDALEEHHAES